MTAPGAGTAPTSGPHGARSLATLVAIAVGGALGGLARHATATALASETGRFPWPTFVVNVAGALALGLVLTAVVGRFPDRPMLRPLLAIGFCGGFTTFSTWMVEVALLVRDGHRGLAWTYLGVSAGAGLVAVWVGLVVGRRLRPAARGGSGR